ncbi:hypothetical protein L6259_03950 [Candidatus Parcubacteria bacterium]|nr:hypothetical protein [Patescibacteria group bacterium]MCG2694390.1 hypothetical protein [Candidatus Parcubacteria bacterium]
MPRDYRQEMYFIFNRLIHTLFDIETANLFMATLINARRPFPEICAEILKRVKTMTAELVNKVSEINDHNLSSWLLYSSLEGEIGGDDRARFGKEQKDKLIELILNSGTDAQKYRSAQFLLTHARALDYEEQDKLFETAGKLFSIFIPLPAQVMELTIALEKWVGLHPVLREQLERIMLAHKARILGYKSGGGGTNNPSMKN